MAPVVSSILGRTGINHVVVKTVNKHANHDRGHRGVEIIRMAKTVSWFQTISNAFHDSAPIAAFKEEVSLQHYRYAQFQ